MTTSLKITSLVLAAALPAAIALELSGIVLPSLLDSLHLFGGLVTSLVLLTAFTDYRRPVTIRRLATCRDAFGPAAAPRSPHALAA